jgi:hypothetical protein
MLAAVRLPEAVVAPLVVVAAAVDTVMDLQAPEMGHPVKAASETLLPVMAATEMLPQGMVPLETQRLAAMHPVISHPVMCLLRVDKRLVVLHPTKHRPTRVLHPKASNPKAIDCVDAGSRHCPMGMAGSAHGLRLDRP